MNQGNGIADQAERETREYYALTYRVFRALAPFYDFIAFPLSFLRDMVVAFASGAPGASVLDVATGTGQQAFAFARAGFYVNAVDISPDMLAVARRKNREINVKFEFADATHLRFEKASFDVTTISFALHDMPFRIREGVLKEMVRVTRPGGAIVIVDYALPVNRIWRWVVYHFVKLYEGAYYVQFIHSDLAGLLRRAGIAVDEEARALLGAVRILKCSHSEGANSRRFGEVA